MQWGCGLRGTIAYALAVDMPTGSQDAARAFKDCTLLVCIVTTLGFGAATKPALEATNMRDTADENEVNMKNLSAAHPEVKRGPNTQDIQNRRSARKQKENRRKSLFIAERQASLMAELDLEDSDDLRKILSTSNGFSKLLFELDEKYFIPFLRVEGWKEQETKENNESTSLLNGTERPSGYAT
ncbi:hypothetical protein CYMTET_44535 [Cymbomonas tetramitiformis]|uniref:Uncharacterized protein n=1 Tax=Cymbomonas tetramitiformis TaxID=36881 RepID=A0AAE0EYX9_9CHLO|nr:hypothetical protein CYMTET_44535 [Cymbomonas tetramitiformis]